MEISINTRQISFCYAAASVSAGNVFNEEFAKSLVNGEDNKIGVPENWSDLGVWISRDGYVPTNEMMKEFREIFSEKLGIDLENRESATHEITDEQKEWLKGRYNFDLLRNAAVGSAEHNNFMLDLVYLNVFTIEETVISTVVTYAPGENGSILSNVENIFSADNFLDSMSETADMLADFLMEYIAKKFGVAEDAPDEVKQWYENTEKIVGQKREVYDVLIKLFDELTDDPEEKNNNVVIPNIEDASGKLKEDFGVRI